MLKAVRTPTNSSPVMGLAEAAQACGVSVSTIRRKRTELMELGAAQTAKGWHIPVTALIALGLMTSTTDAPMTPVEPPVTPGLMPVMTPPVDSQRDALMGEVETLRAKLADAERRAAVAEAVAAERDRIIHAQEMALRMLEASPGKPESTAHTSTATTSVDAEHIDQIEPVFVDAPKPVPAWRRLLGRRA